MKKYLPTLILLLAYQILDAQDASFMYGRVYTDNGKTYEGPIRWGKEEVYWTDVFNAAKERNENLRHLTAEQREELDNRQFRNGDWGDRFASSFGWNWNDNDRDHYNAYVHQFSCQFGEIKTIRPEGSRSAELEMRNGLKIDIDGEGYNDVGLDIKIMDTELGEVEVYWNSIDRVEFMETPAKLSVRFGAPLYGTVEAFGDKFTGFIQWDQDERLSVDKLDGDSDDGDMSIEFGKIKSIERVGSRSRVTLKSGREITLDGSNDVSSGHRGVVVMNSEFASINIPWREFDKVTFLDKPGSPLPTYSSFSAQKELSGTVTAYDGKVYKGRIVFDLDEAYDLELLQGKEGEFEYAMPFRNISSITTNGEYQCGVTLKSGKKIKLGDGQDVDERNQGILVFAGDNTDAAYILWQDVREIVFK
jgi:hypothetical protein